MYSSQYRLLNELVTGMLSIARGGEGPAAIGECEEVNLNRSASLGSQTDDDVGVRIRWHLQDVLGWVMKTITIGPEVLALLLLSDSAGGWRGRA